jgi:hypothetical protein
MDPELYKKVVEHNEEGRRLKYRLSRVGLIIGPLLFALGCLMFAFPVWFRAMYQTGLMGDYFYDKAASASIIMGLYFLYLSVRWLIENRNHDRA